MTREQPTQEELCYRGMQLGRGLRVAVDVVLGGLLLGKGYTFVMANPHDDMSLLVAALVLVAIYVLSNDASVVGNAIQQSRKLRKLRGDLR